MTSYPNGATIWNFLSNFIGNDYGVAGLMGNLYHESGLYPFRKQNDFTEGFIPSHEYTNAVNNGTISESTFVSDQIGYGLAQWTYSSRKQNLYNRTVAAGVDVSDLNAQLRFLKWELENGYSGVLSVLKTATSVRQASDKVLHDFENPADQSEAVERERYNTSLDIYNTYSGSSPIPDPSPDPEPEPDPEPQPEPQPPYVPPGTLGTSSLIMACIVAILAIIKKRRE